MHGFSSNLTSRTHQHNRCHTARFFLLSSLKSNSALNKSSEGTKPTEWSSQPPSLCHHPLQDAGAEVPAGGTHFSLPPEGTSALFQFPELLSNWFPVALMVLWDWGCFKARSSTAKQLTSVGTPESINTCSMMGLKPL